MATKLLHCLICPSRADYSDVSHLLTHVSSKGHLSHLHKLEVRARQEDAASDQLQAYEQWRRDHDIAQLLSERMQQKDNKTAGKREVKVKVKVKRDREISNAPVYSSNNVFENPVLLPPRELRPAKRAFREEDPGEESEYMCSPVSRNKKRQSTDTPNRFLGSQSVWTPDFARDHQSSPAAAAPEPALPATPEASKLKGVIWPGMDLFDAASVDAKRKRNQKKDGSVLSQMEKTSESIRPYEVIYSSDGTKLKERFIDGNINSSSPLQGEEPILASQLPKKRQPLGSLNENTPVNAGRQAKSRNSKARTMAEVRNKAKPSKASRSLVQSSSIGDHLHSTPPFSSAADDTLELWMMAGGASETRSGPNFTAYKNGVVHHSHMNQMGAHNPFNAANNPMYGVRAQLPLVNAPWMQPQSQYPQYPAYSNPYLAYSGNGRAYPDCQQQQPVFFNPDSSVGLAFPPAFSPTRPEWSHQGMPVQNSFQAAIPSTYNNYVGGFSGTEDPFGYSKNPLNAGFDQLATQTNNPIISTNLCTPPPTKKKPSDLSLDGPMSDGVEAAKAYEQELFAASE